MVRVENAMSLDEHIPSVLRGDLFIVTSDDRFLMYAADKAFRKSETFGMILHGEQALRDYLSRIPVTVSPSSLRVYALNRRGKVPAEEVQRLYTEVKSKEG